MYIILNLPYGINILGNDANFDPIIRTTPQTSPIGETGGSGPPLPSIPADSVVETTHSIATQTGLVPESTETPKVYVPQEQMAASSSSDASLDSQQTVGRYRQEPAKLKVLDAKITKAEKHLANLREQAAHTKSGKGGRAKKSSLHEQIEIHQKRLEGLIKERDRIDGPVRSVWVPAVADYLPPTSSGLQERIREQRQEIVDTKTRFTQRKGSFEQRKEKQAVLDDKISKAENYLANLREQAAQTKSGKRGRTKKFSLRTQIEVHEKRLDQLVKERNGLIGNMEERVHTLMREGSIEKVPGGKSGVYFLCDAEGVRRFVIKPSDEEMLTLNNPKLFATPFTRGNDIANPRPGVSTYSGVQNEEMATLVAEHLGIADSTVRSEQMVLTSDTFHDFTDSLTGDRSEFHELYGAPDREKLCTVQEFIPDASDVGLLLLTSLNKDQDEFMSIDRESRDALERESLPKNINQTMFEHAVILSLVCGEVDGNAGNYLLATTDDPQTNTRNIYKIDNAATFPSHNEAIETGANWVLNAYEKPITGETREMVSKIDVRALEKLMRQRGYSQDAIKSMKARVATMKDFANEETLRDFVGMVEEFSQHLSDEYL